MSAMVVEGVKEGGGTAGLPLTSDGQAVKVNVTADVEVDTSLLATSAKQDTAQTTLTAIDGHVDGLETAVASTNTKLDTVNTNLGKLKPIGPGMPSATASASKIFNVAITATGTQSVDLGGANYTGLATAIAAGKQLTLKATCELWYNWGTGAVTISAASTAASNPATQGVPLFNGERATEPAPSGTTHLNILGGAVAGMLSIYICE